jgi:acetylornithine deacetylase/succinyl-diaminopimelate desuccinylase-like protein
MNQTTKSKQFIEKTWDESIIPTLTDYIRIPCKSPNYDHDWQKNGYIDKAIELIANWCKNFGIKGMQLNVHRLPERTPVILMEIAGQTDKKILLYGHMDKQPEMHGWSEDLGPWKPVIKNDRLYGRGGADDGYSAFAALTAIKALQEEGIPHAHCTVLIEASEESGSHDLPYYVDYLQDQIGEPDLVICLDSGCGNYDQLWCTTSLRGNIVGVLSVNILTQGVHSGAASGIVPSSFRIVRQLLSRVENETTGEVLLPALKVKIPQERIDEAKCVAEVMGESVWTEFPFVNQALPMHKEREKLILNRTWEATLSMTGVGGIPDLENAGNVLRPNTSFTISVRTPPTCDANAAAHALKEIFEKNPPYQADVCFDIQSASEGWNSPVMPASLKTAINEASEMYFGKPSCYWGEGGTIPFMAMLGEKFPRAQFMITGVLGPQSNAHGPNEFLDIPTAKKVTGCVAEVIKRFSVS